MQTVLSRFGDVMGTVRENRAALHQGTILDPNNHPSYSDRRREDLALVEEKRASLREDLAALD